MRPATIPVIASERPPLRGFCSISSWRSPQAQYQGAERQQQGDHAEKDRDGAAALGLRADAHESQAEANRPRHQPGHQCQNRQRRDARGPLHAAHLEVLARAAQDLALHRHDAFRAERQPALAARVLGGRFVVIETELRIHPARLAPRLRSKRRRRRFRAAARPRLRFIEKWNRHCGTRPGAGRAGAGRTTLRDRVPGARLPIFGTRLPKPQSQKTIVPDRFSARPCRLLHFLHANQIMEPSSVGAFALNGQFTLAYQRSDMGCGDAGSRDAGWVTLITFS